MTTTGYPAEASTGYGTHLLMRLTNPGLVKGDVNLPTAMWVPVAQITDILEIDMENRLHDVTTARDTWTRHVPGQKHVPSVTFPVLFNPDLAAHSMAFQSEVTRKASIYYAFWRNQRRFFRVYTKPAGYDQRTGFEFYAYVQKIRNLFPHSDMNKAVIMLQVDGPVNPVNASNNEKIIGINGMDLETG